MHFSVQPTTTQLRDAYTTISAIDIFEIGGKGESFLDTWPLHGLIEKRVTPELLKAIAAEHARGRRLFMLTTNLDAGRPVAWDIGAIATHGGQQALDLVRKVMIAAISIPGAFPPGFIEAQGKGRTFEEMHVDGGLAGQFYIAPDSMLASTATSKLPATDFYIIANMKLSSGLQPDRTHDAQHSRPHREHGDQVRDPQCDRPRLCDGDAHGHRLSCRLCRSGLFRARARGVRSRII